MAKLKYDKDTFPKLVEEYARSGLNDRQIAESFGITAACLYNYINRYVEFFDAYQRGKQQAITVVENELFKNCLEREVTEQVIEKTELEGMAVGAVKIKETTKVVLGNVNAQKFWLACHSEKWRRANLPPSEEELPEVELTEEEVKRVKQLMADIYKDIS